MRGLTRVSEEEEEDGDDGATPLMADTTTTQRGSKGTEVIMEGRRGCSERLWQRNGVSSVGGGDEGKVRGEQPASSRRLFSPHLLTVSAPRQGSASSGQYTAEKFE